MRKRPDGYIAVGRFNDADVAIFTSATSDRSRSGELRAPKAKRTARRLTRALDDEWSTVEDDMRQLVQHGEDSAESGIRGSASRVKEGIKRVMVEEGLVDGDDPDALTELDDMMEEATEGITEADLGAAVGALTEIGITATSVEGFFSAVKAFMAGKGKRAEGRATKAEPAQGKPKGLAALRGNIQQRKDRRQARETRWADQEKRGLIPIGKKLRDRFQPYVTKDLGHGIQVKVKRGLRLAVANTGTADKPVFVLTPGPVVGYLEDGEPYFGRGEGAVGALVPVALAAFKAGRQVRQQVQEDRQLSLKPGQTIIIEGIPVTFTGEYDEAGALLMDSDGRRVYV